MKLSKGRRGGKLEINMTPMIDVTFLLLIFFMTVNQVSKMNAEPLELPQLKGSQDQSEAVITVNVDQYGDIVVSSNHLSLGQFASLVGGELAANQNDPTRIKVVLRADRRGNCRVVNEIVAMLVKLDIHQVRIAVRSGEE
jgi:biopolymer transport protein ExbD